jgi:hypothetical protein
VGDSSTRIVAAARAAAGALGLAAALDRPLTAGELATRVGAGARRLAWLCDLLAHEGVLARAGGRYAWRGGEAAPAPGSALLVEALRRDAPLTVAETLGSLEAAALTCHDGIERVPPALVARLAELAGDGVLLDAGCGDGRIAEAVRARNPRARVALVDRDPRLAGPVIAGDLLSAPLPAARVALLSNVLHTMAPPAAERVVARVAAALEPGGALVVREVALDDDRGGPRFGLAFGLSLAVLAADAELPGPARIAAWLAAAGLVPSAPERLGTSILCQGSAARVVQSGGGT